MNPNSQHQIWSLWEYQIYPDFNKRPDYLTVKTNCARFGRLIFGSASTMKIRHAGDASGKLFWEVAILTENHPVHDPAYTEWVHEKWKVFFQNGFGPTCEIRCHARLEAGDRQDGTPADQLIILPPLAHGNVVSE
jgi:hypothetical protein